MSVQTSEEFEEVVIKEEIMTEAQTWPSPVCMCECEDDTDRYNPKDYGLSNKQSEFGYEHLRNQVPNGEVLKTEEITVTSLCGVLVKAEPLDYMCDSCNLPLHKSSAQEKFTSVPETPESHGEVVDPPPIRETVPSEPGLKAKLVSKILKCELCDYRTFMSANLKRHTRNHTKDQ